MGCRLRSAWYSAKNSHTVPPASLVTLATRWPRDSVAPLAATLARRPQEVRCHRRSRTVRSVLRLRPARAWRQQSRRRESPQRRLWLRSRLRQRRRESPAGRRRRLPCAGARPARRLRALASRQRPPAGLRLEVRQGLQRPSGDALPLEQVRWPWPGGHAFRAPTVPGSATPDHRSTRSAGSAPAHPSSAASESNHRR